MEEKLSGLSRLLFQLLFLVDKRVSITNIPAYSASLSFLSSDDEAVTVKSTQGVSYWTRRRYFGKKRSLAFTGTPRRFQMTCRNDTMTTGFVTHLPTNF